nr:MULTISPECIES: acyl-CoA dehydrogenase family protein [Pseudoalteromonas]
MGSYYFMTAMTRERLSISSVAVATAETILKETLEYSKNRIAFGQPIGSLQHNKFTLANLDTEVKIARIYLNDAIDKFNRKKLNVDDAARAKLWTTNLQVKVAEQCMQLHGASGYMSDSSMGKHWVNSRVQKIYGGTSEVLQEVIGKSIGL